MNQKNIHSLRQMAAAAHRGSPPLPQGEAKKAAFEKGLGTNELPTKHQKDPPSKPLQIGLIQSDLPGFTWIRQERDRAFSRQRAQKTQKYGVSKFPSSRSLRPLRDRSSFCSVWLDRFDLLGPVLTFRSPPFRQAQGPEPVEGVFRSPLSHDSPGFGRIHRIPPRIAPKTPMVHTLLPTERPPCHLVTHSPTHPFIPPKLADTWPPHGQSSPREQWRTVKFRTSFSWRFPSRESSASWRCSNAGTVEAIAGWGLFFTPAGQRSAPPGTRR
jgi:hypothetical protein